MTQVLWAYLWDRLPTVVGSAFLATIGATIIYLDGGWPLLRGVMKVGLAVLAGQAVVTMIFLLALWGVWRYLPSRGGPASQDRGVHPQGCPRQHL
jgi:hypothetical protein